MLRLKGITKDYTAAGETVKALKGVSVDFRKSEFVAVLGPSGCGKTTMLNIIGGLDKYTDGDLVIQGRSTKEYTDSDWDDYRNHSVGFVFQSYNLIPHQTVAGNIELALTLSGIPESKRRKRVLDALEKVGLKDQCNKKPNQLSGGQMQRVAIARALINDPEIVLADEPTGALDSETGIQVMELLKEVSRDRLVIMVTHNAELAEQYADRIIRLSDGVIVDDSDPYVSKTETDREKKRGKGKKPHMSFFTALGLSTRNLMTKKARTLLTSFAGSIGIIGIALILAMSTGIEAFIDRIQTDTLSSYPLQITYQNFNMSSLLASREENSNIEHEDGKIYTSASLVNMVNAIAGGTTYNDLGALKEFLESDEAVYIDGNGEKHHISEYVSDIGYSYNVPMLIYKSDVSDGAVRLDPEEVFRKIYGDVYDSMTSGAFSSFSSMVSAWNQLIDNEELLHSQYDLLAGEWPTEKNEVVLFVNSRKELGDIVQYAIGLRDIDEVDGILDKIYAGEKVELEQLSFTYEQLLDMTFKLILPTDLYEKADGKWQDISDDADKLADAVSGGLTIKISAIAMPNPDAVGMTAGTYVGYTQALTDYIVDGINNSDIVGDQLADESTDVFTGTEFAPDEITAEYVKELINSLPEEEKAQIEPYLGMLSDEQLVAMYKERYASSNTYDGNLKKLCYTENKTPESVYIYPISFEAKDRICDIIEDYNKRMEESGNEGKVITYTDTVGLLMSSITTILDAISIVLIGFVSVSLVVSSIMIGVITYISVLERTKEIGILRAVGASKRDISRVFNAETLIVGFTAGIIGIGLTLLLTIPINAIVYSLSGLNITAILPLEGAAILVLISTVLTLIAGLIPSSIAAKRDPVTALRSE